MGFNLFDKIHQINYLSAEMNAMYHKASLKIGLADSILHVLYVIHDYGEGCLLSDIYKGLGISKQTVNSAVRKLEEEGVLYLEQYRGKAKKVVLTEKGKQYVSETAARLYEAEKKAFESWTEDEIDTHIRFMEKYLNSFKEQVQKL